MSPSTRPINDETARFHRIVEHGDAEELRSALELGCAVNSPGRIGLTALMLAMASKDVEKARLLIRHGADLELSDDFNATALRHAVDADFADGVQFLLSLGAERGYHPKYPLKKIEHDFSLPDVAMPQELNGVMSQAEWQAAIAETQQAMREKNANPTIEPMISQVQSVAVLKLFLQAGDELSLAPNEVKRKLLCLETGGVLRSTPQDYQTHKSPRCGNRNPERMDFAFWRDMISTGGNAYAARRHFEDASPFDRPGAVWCFDRFGSSLTQLDDGRYVQIGGEHEDYYDPDFHIYNDVVIHDGKGDFQIYGYPRDVFPPTDFHTATLCGDSIYLVGCLGYPEQRQPGVTSVFRLKLESWEMEAVETKGEMPGWIHKHHARYEPDKNALRIAGGKICVVDADEAMDIIPNSEQFELDLSLFKWSRLK